MSSTTLSAAERVCGRWLPGFDINTVQYADFPIFADPFEFTGECDVIIDFSNAASTERLLDYCEQHGTPVVICTTGHSAAQLDRIRAASAKYAVFRSGNMSLGINLMSELLKQSAAVIVGRQVRRGDHREAPQSEAGCSFGHGFHAG